MRVREDFRFASRGLLLGGRRGFEPAVTLGAVEGAEGAPTDEDAGTYDRLRECVSDGRSHDEPARGGINRPFFDEAAVKQVCPSSNGLGQSELFRDGGSGSFGLEIRQLSTHVAIVAV